MIQQILIFFVSFAALSSQLQAKGSSCGAIFRFQEKNLSEELLKLSKDDPASFRKNTPGEWIEVDGKWVHYVLKGEKGPLRVHLMGLGGDLSHTLNENPIIKQHLTSGRILIIELEGQGLREVLSQHQMAQSKEKPLRKIDFKENANMAYKAAKLILAQHNSSTKDIDIWGGASFGAMHVAAIASKKSRKIKMTQLFAPAITNFENRFLSKKRLKMVEDWRRWLDEKIFSLGSLLGLKLTHSYIHRRKMTESGAANDTVRLKGAASQLFGGRRIDVSKRTHKFFKGTRVQVFTGSRDLVVFSMLHFEFLQKLFLNKIPAAGFFVEGATHDLNGSLEKAQLETINKLTREPESYQGFYQILKDGSVQPLEKSDAKEIYQQASRRAWQVLSPDLKKTYAKIGIKINYPKGW